MINHVSIKSFTLLLFQLLYWYDSPMLEGCKAQHLHEATVLSFHYQHTRKQASCITTMKPITTKMQHNEKRIITSRILKFKGMKQNSSFQHWKSKIKRNITNRIFKCKPMSSLSTITKQPHQILMPYSSNCFHLNLKLLLSLSPASKPQTIKLINHNSQRMQQKNQPHTPNVNSKHWQVTIWQTRYKISNNNDLKHNHYLLLSKFLTATLVLSSKRPR